MSTAHACTVLCADGLGCLLVVFVGGEFHPGEREVVVGQDLVRVGRSLRDVVWCFIDEGVGRPTAAIRPWLLGRETGTVAVRDAELFIGFYSACGGESDGLCGGIDGARNVRRVGAVEEGAKTEGECHSPVLPPERMAVKHGVHPMRLVPPGGE